MKTSVEWLYNEWAKNGTIFLEDLEQAKEMEKENIKLAFASGVISGSLRIGVADAEQYYNETFKSE